MKLQTKHFIPEEDFSRSFVKRLHKELKLAQALGKETFTLLPISAKPHWTGGYGHAGEDECLVAKKITLQLLSYFEGYYVSFPINRTFAFEFSIKPLPSTYDPFRFL